MRKKLIGAFLLKPDFSVIHLQKIEILFFEPVKIIQHKKNNSISSFQNKHFSKMTCEIHMSFYPRIPYEINICDYFAPISRHFDVAEIYEDIDIDGREITFVGASGIAAASVPIPTVRKIERELNVVVRFNAIPDPETTDSGYAWWAYSNGKILEHHPSEENDDIIEFINECWDWDGFKDYDNTEFIARYAQIQSEIFDRELDEEKEKYTERFGHPPLPYDLADEIKDASLEYWIEWNANTNGDEWLDNDEDGDENNKVYGNDIDAKLGL